MPIHVTYHGDGRVTEEFIKDAKLRDPKLWNFEDKKEAAPPAKCEKCGRFTPKALVHKCPSS